VQLEGLQRKGWVVVAWRGRWHPQSESRAGTWRGCRAAGEAAALRVAASFG